MKFTENVDKKFLTEKELIFFLFFIFLAQILKLRLIRKMWYYVNKNICSFCYQFLHKNDNTENIKANC